VILGDFVVYKISQRKYKIIKFNIMFIQKNGMQINENEIYRSVVGDLVKILKIDLKENRLHCYNISNSCNSWHRIDSAIKDNKFRDEKIK